MKADERVSIEISTTTSDIIKAVILNRRSCEGHIIYGEEVRDAIIAILQSRRAAEQAALPAVDGMANKIELAICEWNQSGFNEERQEVIVAALTPLYAKLAEYAKVLGECRNHLLLKGGQKVDVAPPNCPPFYRPIDNSGDLFIRDRLLAKLDALLGAKGGEDGKDQ